MSAKRRFERRRLIQRGEPVPRHLEPYDWVANCENKEMKREIHRWQQQAMAMERQERARRGLEPGPRQCRAEAKASTDQNLQNLLNQGGLSLHKAHQPSLNKANSSQQLQKKRQFQKAKSPSPMQKVHQSLQMLSRQWSLSLQEGRMSSLHKARMSSPKKEMMLLMMVLMMEALRISE